MPPLLPVEESDMLNPGHSVYQIITDRFFEGDPGIRPSAELFSSDQSNLRKYLGGDWEGIIRKIKDGYITEMGFKAILISQPVENVHTCMGDEGGTTSYHGYWPRDFLKANAYFGLLDKFKELLDVAHEKGLKVIIDFTPNHTSPALELNPGYMENGALYRRGQFIASYSGDMERVFLHNGGTDFLDAEDSLYRNLYDLAGLDQMNPQVDAILREGIGFWLEYGVDGVRIDTAKHIPPGWLKSFSGCIHAYKPAFVFGEWFLHAHESPSDNAALANDSGISLLHFMFSHTLRSIFHGGGGFEQFIDMLSGSANSYEHLYDQLIFLDNHDMTRFTVHENPSLTDLALSLLLTSIGIPLVYYGTEQYMCGGDDPNNRAMMSAFNRETSAYRILSQLNRLRERNFAIAYGGIKVLYMTNRVLVFERSYKRDVALIMLNVEESTHEIPEMVTSLPKGEYSSLLEQVFAGNDICINSGGRLSYKVLAPQSAYVYAYESEQEEPVAVHYYPKAGVPGNEIIIHGRHLGDRGGLFVGGQCANVISWKADEIVARIPYLSAGSHKIMGTTGQESEFLLPGRLTVWTAPLVTVRFVVTNAFTDYASQIYVSGNVYELGEWEIDRARGPFYNHIVYRYPSWYCDISLPADCTVEFILFKKNKSGSVDREKGLPHKFTTPREGVSEITVEWQS
ncbi:alpha-amylase family glycosyl hydrolase [Paenibacillus sp. FSL E2-0201]|uniref:alpha-amylase family glycosyl hydrolase n=1 Tax=Paenibacillus sp. FSL E2-0201 TaxID=2954726 RepID=UPI0030D8C837